MTNPAAPDTTVDLDSIASDVLVLVGMVLVTVGLVALFGFAIAALIDGIALVALGVNRARRLDGPRL